MKNDDRTVKTVISTVLTILPALIGTLALEMIPLEEEMMKAPMLTGILIVPVIMAAVNLLCIWFTHKDRGNDEQSGKVMNMIYLLMPVLSLCVVGAMISFLMGFEDSDALIAFVISIMFIVIGNETPKFRRNSTLGVKLPWTLRNDDNWRATHRLTGKLWVIGGFIMALGMLLPFNGVRIGIFVAMLAVMITVPVAYSWNYNRKQMKDGTCSESERKPVTTVGKKGMVFSVVMIVAVSILVIVTLFAGDIEFRLGEDGLKAEANFYSDFEVLYEDIDSVELREGKAAGSRTFGYGGVSMNCGTFRNAELGTHTRYTVEGAESHILLTCGDEHVVISTGSDEGNAALAEKLETEID